MNNTESHAERVGTDAAIHFAARYWQHGDDPEAQFALGQLSLAVHNLRERLGAKQDLLDRAETAEKYAEQLQNELAEIADAREKVSRLRTLGTFWFDNSKEDPFYHKEPGEKMMYWYAAGNGILEIVGRSDD